MRNCGCGGGAYTYEKKDDLVMLEAGIAGAEATDYRAAHGARFGRINRRDLELDSDGAASRLTQGTKKPRTMPGLLSSWKLSRIQYFATTGPPQLKR